MKIRIDLIWIMLALVGLINSQNAPDETQSLLWLVAAGAAVIMSIGRGPDKPLGV